MIPNRSQWLYDLFRRYLIHRYCPHHFDGVRVAKGGPPPAAWDGPCLVAMNHPSWWDLVMCFVLSDLFPGRADWGPIEAAGVAKYQFLERAGLYAIDTATLAGAKRFTQVSRALLDRDDVTLWMFPQGSFADPRQRPIRMKSGTGRLAAHMATGVVLPVALEYPFWDERTPEALAWFGEPIRVSDHPGLTADEWTALIAERLTTCQDRLAGEAMSRDAQRFTTLVHGRVGVGGVYDYWRMLWAWVRGERFDLRHTLRP